MVTELDENCVFGSACMLEGSAESLTRLTAVEATLTIPFLIGFVLVKGRRGYCGVLFLLTQQMVTELDENCGFDSVKRAHRVFLHLLSFCSEWLQSSTGSVYFVLLVCCREAQRAVFKSTQWFCQINLYF